MSVPLIIGLLALLLIVVLGAGLRRKNAQTASSMQSLWVIILVVGVAAILLFLVLGHRI